MDADGDKLGDSEIEDDGEGLALMDNETERDSEALGDRDVLADGVRLGD